MTPYFLILALLLALAPAVIAHGKGRNFLLWWLYGVVLGPVALVHSILLRNIRRPARDAGPEGRELPWSSPWPLMLRIAASLAIAVVAVAVYRFFVPPVFDRTAAKPEIAVSTDRTPPAQAAPAVPSSEAEPGGSGGQTAVKAPETDAAPSVNVTVRQDTAPVAESPAETGVSKPAAAPEPAAPKPEPALPEIASAPPPPAPAAPESASAPPPPPPSPAAPSGDQLERTAPLERTVAEKPAAEPEAKAVREQPAVKDVNTLAARTTPPEGMSSSPPDPVIAPSPREDSMQREPEEQPARRKPATRKAATPKPAPEQPQAATPSDVTAVGDTVRVVQQALAERGYDPGPINGRAGRKTEQAIRKFQEDRGLPATGSIDYAVLETLNIVGPRVHAFQPPPGTAPGR